MRSSRLLLIPALTLTLASPAGAETPQSGVPSRPSQLSPLAPSGSGPGHTDDKSGRPQCAPRSPPRRVGRAFPLRRPRRRNRVSPVSRSS